MSAMQGFWRRQFAPQATTWQRWFDFVFGAVAPIVCVVADPCVFRADGPWPRPYVPYATAAYIFIALEILTLYAWLAIPRKGSVLTLALAGPLFAGALASIGLGIRMLPLTMIGLVVLIGVLGLTPFFTGFVFLRNAVRAWRSLPESDRPHLSREIAAMFAFLTMGVAIGGQWMCDRSMTQLLADPDSAGARRVVRLLSASWTLDDMVVAWQKETDPVHKDRLAKVYREVTGQSIEDRSSRLRD